MNINSDRINKMLCRLTAIFNIIMGRPVVANINLRDTLHVDMSKSPNGVFLNITVDMNGLPHEGKRTPFIFSYSDAERDGDTHKVEYTQSM